MKRRFFQYGGLAATAVVAAGLVMTGPVEAQNYAAGTPSVSTLRTPDGKPDLSGLWNGSSFSNASVAKCGPTQKGCFENRPGTFPVRQEENGDVSQRVS